jgi:hypothetical protein
MSHQTISAVSPLQACPHLGLSALQLYFPIQPSPCSSLFETEDLLHGHLDSIWINSSELFNKDTLPDTITLIGLSKGVWINPDQQYQGTEVYYASAVNDRYILLRHEFGNKWCLWGCFKRRTVSIEVLIRDARVIFLVNVPLRTVSSKRLLHH